jgi:hypothetical protein
MLFVVQADVDSSTTAHSARRRRFAWLIDSDLSVEVADGGYPASPVSSRVACDTPVEPFPAGGLPRAPPVPPAAALADTVVLVPFDISGCIPE